MNSTIKICRLCLETISGNDFDAIDDIAKRMLENLLLTTDLNIIEEPLMCEKCMVNLDKSVNFKSTCLNTESLGEIKSEKNRDDVHRDHKSCRFCMRDSKIKGCYFNKTNQDVFIADVVQKHIPELKFDSAQQVVTCTSCLDALQNLSSFVTRCLDVEDKVRKYAASLHDTPGQINLYDIQQLISKPLMKREDSYNDENSSESIYFKSGDVDLKTENRKEGFEEVDNLAVDIKNEEIHIKSDQSETESFQEEDVLSHTENNINLLETEECSLMPPHKTPLQVLLSECDERIMNKLLNPESSVQKNTSRKVYQRKPFLFQARRKLNRENPSQTNQCEHFSKITMHQCQHCSFQTKRKIDLKSHLVTHENPLEINMYPCKYCSYQTKHKNNLNRHLIIHKNPSETNIYKCEHCSYHTSHKSNLKRHLMLHNNPSETPIFHCEHCSFQTKHKISLKSHLLNHKNPSEINIYQCEQCSYQTKHKSNVKRHLMVHKNSSEISMFQCEHCSFQTKHKISLKNHLLSHKNLSEINMYQCEHCSYQTRYKDMLKRHLVRHKKTSEINLYQCERCSYQAKRKSDLKTHLVRHKSPSELTMYQCEHCSYQAKRKGQLKSHLLLH